MEQANLNPTENSKENLGLIHIYCGDGKGKTTAATGLALRMVGAGFRVLFARFLKNDCSSELNILKNIPGIHVIHTPRDYGFIWNMSENEKKKAGAFYTQLLETAMNTAITQNYDMLILDEINVAVDIKLIEADCLLRTIKKKPAHLELVLTGRNPHPSLLSLADYVSDIHCIKHPFQNGITSRIGIEE